LTHRVEQCLADTTQAGQPGCPGWYEIHPLSIQEVAFMTTTAEPSSLFVLHAPLFTVAPLPRSLMSLDRIAEAHGVNQLESLVDLLIADEVIAVPPGDRVTVLEDGLTSVLVEVIDGQHQGRQGWVPTTWLQPTSAAPTGKDAHVSAA
jgi:hypothetical protein